MYSIVILFLLPLFIGDMNAQSTDQEIEERIQGFCGTDQVHRKLIENSDQETVKRIRAAEQKLKESKENYQEDGGRATVRTIPVVFHVIHDNGPEDIPSEVVENTIERLNMDFRKMNNDTSDIVNAFKSIAADIEVEFRLAQKAPNGDCHRGITRHQDERTEHEMPSGWNSGDGLKNIVQWDPSSYMNVWVVRSINGGVGGYALKPSGANSFPGKDGIVVEYGNIGSDERTLTHETGHYLNLDHTWGTGGQAGDSGNCNDDDNIGDTPNTVGWMGCNGGDPAGAFSCGNQDNIQNYMDYSFCHRMFTKGQKTAMRNALNSTVADRNELWSNNNLQETGVSGSDILCEAAFTQEVRTICQGASIDFSDRSYHGVTSWNWQFEGGNADDPSSQNPTVTYPDTGTFDVTLTVGNGSSTISTTIEDHIHVLESPGSELPWVDPLDWMDSLEANSDYFIQNPAGDPVEWEHTQEAGEGGSPGCIRLENHQNSGGQLDAFLTSTMDASQIPDGDLQVSFDLAFARSNTNNADELKVYASTDCGKSWFDIWSTNGGDLETAPSTSSPFIPTNEQWEHVVINDGPFSGGVFNLEDLRLKFEFISDGGNNIYIDNINVHDRNNVGLEEKEGSSSNMEIRPNPVHDRGNVILDLSGNEKVRMELFDILGEKVGTIQQEREFRMGEHRIGFDLRGLEAGPYFIRARIGEQTITRKLFKD